MTLGAMSLIFEGVVSILLIAVIVFAIKLNRRILALRTQESELKEMIGQFNEAAIQAELSASHLKVAGTDSERNLRATIERAQAMRDDLSFMIERGGNMSDRVIRSIARSRERPPTAPMDKPLEPATEERADLKTKRNAERAVEGLVDRFASRAEPSLWRTATGESSNSQTDIMPAGDESPTIDREHWFDDDPLPVESPADPTAAAGPRVSAWMPGAGSKAVEIPEEMGVEDTENSSRLDAERQMLETLRTSGVRR